MSETYARWIVGIFSLLVAAAGWFYLLYSRAAHKLSGVEDPIVNRRRIKLRRVGGVVMMLIGAAFYVDCDALFRRDLRLFVAMLLALLALMAGVLLLALIDLRLTREIRRRKL